MDPITSIHDARLPQPHSWGQLPAPLRQYLEMLSKRRSTCPDDEIDQIDEEMLTLLLPFARQ